MKNRMLFRVAVVAILPSFLLISCTKRQDWNQFRGPEGNMSFTSSNLPEEWGNGKNIKWATGLDGTGFSSPVVWGDKVFITSAFPEKINPAPQRPAGPPPQPGQGPQQGPPPQPGQGLQQGPPPQPGQGPQEGMAPRPGQGAPQPPQWQSMPEIRDTSYLTESYRWELICFDLNSGKEIWRQVAYQGVPRAAKNASSTYACESPVTDGNRVIAYFGMNGLYCYDMDGKLLWQKDLGAYYTQKGWGTGSSPVIYNDVVYIQFDNEESSSLIAIDPATGNEKWKVARDEKTTYSTPYIWKNKVRTEIVTCGRTARSYDPETGKLLWELNTGGEMVIPSPTGNEELLYIGNAGGREPKSILYAVKAGTSGEIAWKSEESGLANPSPLLYNGHLYIIGSRGEIAVLNASNGDLKYQKRINGIGGCWASPWASNGNIYYLDEKGSTHVFKEGETYEKVADYTLEGNKFWASVAVTGDSYIFRAGDKLYCIKK